MLDHPHRIANRANGSTFAATKINQRLSAWRTFQTLAASAGLLFLGQASNAAAIFKADNSDNLNLATSWTNAVVPGASDVAKWDATVTGANTVVLGGDLTWKGISITSPGGWVTIGAGNTLTLGNSGIDLSGASQGLTISSSLSLAAGNQVWNVTSGQLLTLDTGAFSRAPQATLNVQGYSVAAGNITNDATGIIGTWASYDTGAATAYATISGGYIAGYAGTYAADPTAVTDSTGSVNYDLFGFGALPGGVSFNTLRYLGGSGTVSGAFTANGLMNLVSTLTLSGGITAGAGKELVVNSAAATVLSGTISDNAGGASSLVKVGPGRLTLSAATASSFSGGSYINQGEVWYARAGALGTGDIKVSSGSQLTLRPNGTAVSPNLNIAGTGTGSSGVILVQAVNATLGGKMTLDANATIGSDNSTGNGLTVNGDIELGANTLTLKPGVATRPMAIKLNGQIHGTGGLTINGSSLTTGTISVTLANSNSFSGNTVFSVNNAASGTGMQTLVLTNVNALQQSTLDTTAASAFKQLTFVIPGNNTYYLGGLAGADDLEIGGNTLDIGRNAANTTYAGAISGVGGNLVKSGAGTLTLSGTNIYTGTTTISNGTLALADGGTIASGTIINYGTFDVSAIAGGYHLSAKTLQGAGTVAGPIAVDSDATLTLGGSAGTAGVGTMTVTGDLTLNGTTVLRLNKGGTSDQIVASGATVLGGTVNLNVVGAALANGDEFQIFSAGNSGTPTIIGNPGAGLEWDASLLNSEGKIRVVAGSNPPSFTTGLSDQSVQCGSGVTFSASATGTAPLTYNWRINGTLVASGTDLTTYTTNNIHSAGDVYTVSVQVTNLVGSTTNSTCTLTVVDTQNPTITMAGPNPMSVLLGHAFIDPGATAIDGCADVIAPVVTGTVDTNTLGSYVLTYTADDGNGNVTTSNRTVNVVLYQDGIWTSTATGLWTGSANWTNQLMAQGVDATADFNQVDITVDTTVHLDQSLSIGHLIFGDTTVTSGGGWIVDDNGNPANTLTLEVSGGTPNITVNALATSRKVFFNLNLAGTQGLQKDGAGWLAFTNANYISGDTTIAGGTLEIQNSHSLGAGSVVINDGAMLLLNSVSDSPIVLTNDITMAGTGFNNIQNGAISMVDGSTHTLSGTLTLNGDASISAYNKLGNNLVLDGPVNLSYYTLSLAPNNVSANRVDWVINGVISGDGGLNWSSRANADSTLTLNAANTYSGETAISTGYAGIENRVGNLVIGNALALQNSTLNYNNGVVQFGGNSQTYRFAGLKGTSALVLTNLNGQPVTLTVSNIFDMTFEGALSDADLGGSLIKDGAATLLLAGTNSYKGDTTINVGRLEIMAADSLAPGKLRIANGAAVQLDYSGTREITGLFLNGVAQVSGTWGATGSGAANIDDTHFLGAGTVTVTGTVTPPMPTIAGFATGPGANEFTVQLSTDIAGNVITLMTTNLGASPILWAPIQTNAVPGGVFSFTIPKGTNAAAFYRLMGSN